MEPEEGRVNTDGEVKMFCRDISIFLLDTSILK